MTGPEKRRLAALALIHLLALVVLAFWAIRGWVLATIPTLVAVMSLGAVIWLVQRGTRSQAELELENQRLAGQLDRRINEIFSLQEMSYVLAESLQRERIAEQVVRYAIRFLQSDGAAVALASENGHLVVAAAEGSLRDQVGLAIPGSSRALIQRAVDRERIEVGYPAPGEPLEVLPGRKALSGAAAPLRAHGLSLGAIVVADRRHGAFSPEDFWLLSTLATHVSVVVANSRLFELVQQANEEWETAFNALSTGIVVLDESGTIRRANRGIARLLGADQATVLGRPFWASIVGAEDEAMEVMASARRGERPAPVTIRSSALNRIVRLTAAPLGEPGAAPAVVVLVEDVTEQQALEAQLIQSEKLAAVGFLVSGVAHELNNPLASIAGLSEFLAERPDTPDGVRDHLRVIREQVERAERIVRNLLTFARKGAPRQEPLELNELLAKTVELVAYEVRVRGVELIQRMPAERLSVRGNRDELLQVLLNLITNALQSLHQLPGESSAPRRIELSLERDGARALVRVRDTGPGIPAAIAPQLFMPFFTTKGPGEGTGLGLSISYGIIESHGGRLGYAAPPNGGAEFSFSLPLLTEATLSLRRVLVSLTDSTGEVTVRTVLEPAGYRVVTATSGSDALARHQATPFPVIVTDLATTTDDGHLLAERLLSPDAARPDHLFVSAADGAMPLAPGATGVRPLPMPFLPRDLFEAARDLLLPEPSKAV